MNRRGFSLIELLVGMVLVSAVGLSIYQLLSTNQRLYRQQSERVDLNSTLRGAVSILPSELREANARDSMESDLAAISSTAISYKAMRSLGVLCLPPVSAAGTGTITLWRSMIYGIRGIDPTRDSIMVFAERDPGTRTDNYWIHANVVTATPGTLCPAAAPSLTLALNNVYPSGGLAHALAGAPIRTFEMMQVLTYTDGLGDDWLGARQYVKGTGWTTTQPVIGPLESGGLQFTYFDSLGVATTTPTEVARIGVTVAGMTQGVVRRGSSMARLVDTLATHVALRNNTR
ncbi:MAG: prepilin-type N-terminal cleavage/methylation domain-containing protein [Gemmatimonadota bacterium]|nr:prepilin-type N-terminal cleavage/methylation domain-containing protein [Gemmatimonadota bacterium]MDH3369480.1 prepilin-type N-terminal cleavage/methylation domain-containing protein [Gemmatimonadota bacterium]MDH3479247.1 prepilin-type N-terminal cleavage/methylation domain-containing protein [Gemmatimonadota bacterium]MDH3571164.1 prepilin-type N-terminal cleavage/methylation domain-containing protein [Gemmatimonadota bacterium]MDH5550389.1 prepilin-type N-terminal cleavage/methylation do